MAKSLDVETVAGRDPGTGIEGGGRAIVPVDPAARRPALWRELLLIGICYGCYSLIRNLVPGQRSMAIERANDLLALQRALHIDVELAVNWLFAGSPWLAVAGNVYYATLHFVVTIGVLAWLYIRRPGLYRSYRLILLAGSMIALAGYWLFPLAPPRMLPTFVDTGAVFDTVGGYDSAPVAAVSNQYAAMPSLHIAWALWCALTVFLIARRGWVKALAVAYPVATLIVILGTANHFVLDALGGGLVLLGGIGVAWLRGSFLDQRAHPVGVG